ncbi:MAG: hypothetical protein OEM26_19250, partial [Saprospiraceae bacterium]|nr:hypothetical protein [Saprospiraceae bacterium]
MPRYTICLLLCLACGLSLHAQILTEFSFEPEFQQLKIDDEGTEAQVIAILRDRTGYMWFGTEDGLYRYNGYEFAAFRHDPSDSLSIAGNSVQSLFEDKDGMIWCGTTRGLSRFDPVTQCFQTILSDSTQRGLVGSEIYDIEQDGTGALWIASWGGLNLIDPITSAVEHILQQTDTEAGLPDFRVMNVCISAEIVWVATLGGLCAIFQDGTKQRNFVHYFDQPGNEQSLYGNSVYWVHQDQSGSLWYGTHNGFGKIHFPDEGSLADRLENVSFELVLPETYGRGDEVIWKIQENDGQHLWLSSWGQGLIRYSLPDGKIDRFLHDPEDEQSISNNGISSLFVDPDSLGGSVWVGTLKGINVYHPEKRKFHHIKHDPEAPGSLSNSHIHSIFEDREGKLWVGTINGLNLLKPQSNSFERFVTRPGNPNGLRSNHILSIYEDHSGRIWVGTFEGLTWFDPSTRRFRTEPMLDRIDDRILRTYDFEEDGDSILWLGTRHGLVKYHFSESSVRKFDQDPTDVRSLPNSEVRSLFIDSQGRFWVGTANGLALFDRASETVRRLNLFGEGHHSQTDPAIWSIHEDSTGIL